MKYEIQGGNFPVLICEMNKGETMVTQRGGMSWMSNHIEMTTTTGGGILKGLGRAMSGESMFLNYYTASQDNQSIAFASSFAGKILPYDLTNTPGLIAQKRAFLASTPGVDLNVHFTKKLGAGFFGGEGFILQRLSGTGLAFLEIDGDLMEYTLAPGETIKIDQGHLAAMEPTVTFDIQTVKGMKNVLFGGEGLFLGTLTGPGKIWLQTMPLSNLANIVLASSMAK